VLDKWIECYYGQSGTGKSESVAAVIKRIYLETGKTFRILVGDGSGATYAALVGAGLAEIIDYTTRDWPLSTLSQLCEGWWPLDPADPKSPMKAMTPEKFASLGGYAIEGLSVGANYIMGDRKGGFAARAALGEKIAGDSPVQLIDLERDPNTQLTKPGTGPGLAFGGVTLGGYGHAQRRMLGFIEKSKGLPGWVIWTAHERAGEDKVSNQKLIGPEVAGGALTASLSRYFNNTLHFATAEKTAKEKDDHTQKLVDVIDSEYRIYTRDHFRPEANTFIKYKAVCRTPKPKDMPLYLESDTPGASIIEFYERIRKAREEDIAALRKPAA
jgi:hypothetical protein